MTPLKYFLRRSLLVIGLLLCSLFNYAQNLGYVWGHVINDTGYLNLGYSVVDAPGNVYMAGAFAGSADFDPGPGTVNLISAGGVDGFVCKLNTAGNLLWALQLGGAGADTAKYITVDATGNVYVAGGFSGTVDFDPGPGTASLSAQAGSDAFVAKYDAAGNYVWAVSFAESNNSSGKAVAVDVNGNVYVTGNFSGDISFPDNTSYSSLGGNDVFICKLNSGGGFVWARRIGGTSLDDATGIVADASGNVFALGMFKEGIIDLDPGPDTANYWAGTSLTYLDKLDANGGLIWAMRTFAQNGHDLKMDGSGNLYLAGNVSAAYDFDPGPDTVIIGKARTLMDYFWVLTSDTGYVLAKSFDGTGDANSANFDAAGNIYVAGGTGAYHKWDNKGNLIWSGYYGVNNPCKTIGVDGMQNVYTMGDFHTPIDLNPGADTAIFRPVYSGIFVNKLAQSAGGSLPLTWLNLEGHLNNQQQTTLNFTVNEENVKGYIVEKSMDGSSYNNMASLQSKGNGTHSYVYTEPTSLQQTAWYRILQTDLDGHAGYSAVIRLVAGKARLSAAVLPVPARGNVTLQINGEELLHTRAVLVDLKGIQVRSVLINDYTTPIDLHNLPGGLYLLQLANGSSLKILHQE